MIKNILDFIGNTPMIKLEGINVKLEHLNPSGSVKDRMAKYIIEQAEKKGLLKKGYTIIEATSGNTGNAFSMVSSIKGYKMVVVMPRGLTKERVEIMHGFGAKVVYVKEDCFDCAIKKALQLGKRKKTYLPKQFENEWNINEHEKNLGKEILKEVKKVDAFVAGVGTGGTLIGVGRTLRKKFPKVKLFALEPDECSVIPNMGIGKIFSSKKDNVCKHHGIEGIGDGIVPDIIRRNKDMIDGVITIKTKEAIKAIKRIAKEYGILVGPSSGANFLAAKKLKKRYRNVVTLFPDEGEKYLSEGLFD